MCRVRLHSHVCVWNGVNANDGWEQITWVVFPKIQFFPIQSNIFPPNVPPRVVLTSLGLGWTLSKTQRYAQIENECVSAVWVLFNKYNSCNSETRNSVKSRIGEIMFRGFWSFQYIIKTLEFCGDVTDFYAISWVHCIYQMVTKIQHYRQIFLASQQNIYFSTHTKTITMAGNIFVPILKNIELGFWLKNV